MKKVTKTIFKIVTNIILLNTALAQKGFQAGVQIIPQFTWLENQDDRNNPDFEYLTTFNGAGGIQLQYGFTQNHGIGLDGLYSYQGQWYRLSTVDYYKRVDYIKVPLTYVYTYHFSDKTIFIGKIGPQVGLLTSAKLMDKAGLDVISYQTKLYNNTTIGGLIAAGFAIQMTDNYFLSFLARYDYTIGSDENNNYNGHINKPNSTLPPSNRAATHNITAGLSVGFSYLFVSNK